MAFEARDLMIDVLPARDLVGQMACVAVSPNAPAPCAPPSCQKNTAKFEGVTDEGGGLRELAALREQLRRALRS